MIVFGQELTADHAKLVGPILGGILAVSGFVAGRWSNYVLKSRFKREDLVSTSIVVEMYSHPAEGNGPPEMLTASRTSSLDDFFQNPVLVAAIRKAAQRHPGLLRLQHPSAHRLMMVEAENWLQGLHPQANLDFIVGRRTALHPVLIGFAAYPAGVAGTGHLHDEVDRLVLMVVNRQTAEHLVSVSKDEVADTSSRRFPKRVFDLVREWDRIRNSASQNPNGELVRPLNLRVTAPAGAA